MLGLAGIALFASTRTDSPLAAALSALAAFVTSQVLDLIDATRAIKPYLPTHYWLSFVDLFRDPILWRGIQRGVAAPSRLPRRVPRRGLGQLHDEGHHELRPAPAGIRRAGLGRRLSPGSW